MNTVETDLMKVCIYSTSLISRTIYIKIVFACIWYTVYACIWYAFYGV